MVVKNKAKSKRKSGILGRIHIIIGLLIIICGLIVVFLPWIKATYYEYLKSSLINKWYYAVLDNPDWQPQLNTDDDGYEIVDELEFDDTWEEDPNAVFDVDYLFANMEGIISIEKINVRSPILRGVTTKNLDIAICALESAPEMGQTGNYCLAGHYSRIYGRHLNRLGEVSAGDIIIVENGIYKYKYEVYDTFSVTAEDTWVMADDGDRKLITLITCDYNMEPMGRLIVKGELLTVE